jgi:hypothetical protein
MGEAAHALITPGLLLSTFFPIHYSQMTLPFNALKYLCHEDVQESAGTVPCILNLSTTNG